MTEFVPLKIPEKKIIERDVERPAAEFAGLLGWQSHRYQVTGKRAMSDRIFMKQGRVFFIEFKRPGKKPTKKQCLKILEKRQNGFLATWFDDIDEAISWIQAVDRHYFSGFPEQPEQRECPVTGRWKR